MARKPLHFIFVLDVSGSMLRGGRIQALNNAIAEVLPHLRDEANANPHAEMLIRVLAFANEAEWVVERPTPVGELQWQRLEAVPKGFTELGSALRVLAGTMAELDAEGATYPPAIILVSDGRPTQSSGVSFAEGLQDLLATRCGEAAVRLALGVGRDADMHSMRRFIGNEDVPLLRAENPEQLVDYIVWASKAASKLASRPVVGKDGAVTAQAAPPVPMGDAIWSTLGMSGTTGWGVADATVIGSYHIREQLPNQDRALTWTSPDGGSAVITVADGHGHHAHFRSDVGADLATRCLLDVLVAALPEPDLVAVATEVVARWQAAVEAHVEAEPFLPTDFVRDVYTPYGATLLAVATTPTRLFALQVGDGDLVAVRASGEAFRPVPEDPSLDGIHTASMCQPDPLSSFRYATVDLDDGSDPVALAFVCTDGFGKARVDAGGWWRQTGEELVGFVRDRGLPWVAEQLPGWLEEPAQIGGDDTTLAVVARVPAASPLDDDDKTVETVAVDGYDPTAPTVAVDLPDSWSS